MDDGVLRRERKAYPKSTASRAREPPENLRATTGTLDPVTIIMVQESNDTTKEVYGE